MDSLLHHKKLPVDSYLAGEMYLTGEEEKHFPHLESPKLQQTC